jgi:hypothetical protein
MEPGKDSFLWRFKWHIVIICTALVIVALLAIFTNIFQTAEDSMLRQLVLLLGALVFISALLAMTSKLFKMLDALRDNSAKLEQVTSALEKIHSGLAQINHSTRLTETAKSIAFRDADKQSLRDAVFEKLQQHNFDTAYEIIDEIAEHADYKELAEQLRGQADEFRDATEQERINQVIAHIEKLLDNYEWAKASSQIESLIKTNPDNEKAKGMRLQLLDKKEDRKKVLLAAWDDAVKNQETDRSLEILKELDLYLTPNEALALQEAAKDVFRTKLHNLGMQFSIAVSEKRWMEALDVGEQIVSDFPNSRMCEEIRDKINILRQKVQLQQS